MVPHRRGCVPGVAGSLRGAAGEHEILHECASIEATVNQLEADGPKAFPDLA
jgi:hypothetical protein